MLYQSTIADYLSVGNRNWLITSAHNSHCFRDRHSRLTCLATVPKKLPNWHGVSDVHWLVSWCLQFNNAVHIEYAVGLGTLTVALSRAHTALVPERSSRMLCIVGIYIEGSGFFRFCELKFICRFILMDSFNLFKRFYFCKSVVSTMFLIFFLYQL